MSSSSLISKLALITTISGSIIVYYNRTVSYNDTMFKREQFKKLNLHKEKINATQVPIDANYKICHFVRHAQGTHNVAGELNPLGYLLEEHEDAVLTELGVSQCIVLNESIKTKLKNAQVLLVSPMRRTIETAYHSFPHLIGKIDWIAHEDLREQSGFHPCDRRRTISEYKKTYPFVDYSLIASDTDPLYPIYNTVREPEVEVMKRIDKFMVWLSTREEKELIIVTHSAYLRTLLGSLDDSVTSVDEVHFKNGELRTYLIQLPSKSTADATAAAAVVNTVTH